MANHAANSKGGTEKRHYPPSYYRYRKENPTISIRLTKQMKEVIDKVRGDTSYSKFLKSLIESSEMLDQITQERAEISEALTSLEDERNALTKLEHFTISCPQCGKPLQFRHVNEDYWNKKVQPILQTAFSGFFHNPDCRDIRSHTTKK